jgi:hypothetical protein
MTGDDVEYGRSPALDLAGTGQDHSQSQGATRCRLATDGIRASGRGSAQPRRWQPRSAGQQSRELAAAVRSAACNDPLSFLLRSVGRSRSRFARPDGLVLQPSLNGDRAAFVDPVPRWGWTPSAVGHDLDAIAILRDRLVGGGTIIGTISRYLANPIVNLIQQRRYVRRIVPILIRQRLRHNHAACGINPQIQLSPFPVRLGSMPGLQP